MADPTSRDSSGGVQAAAAQGSAAAGDLQVSVLLPAYNAEATLAECLDSLLGQTLAEIEIVAVNDGSTDGTARILAEAAARDGRLRAITRPHRGLVAALNAGLTECRAPYVARMDADDVAHPTRLAVQLAWAQQHPDCGLISCLVEPFTAKGRLAGGVRDYHDWMNGLRDDEAMKANLFVESPLPHPGFFARRSLYHRLWGYRESDWPEDYDFLLRAAAAGVRFGKVPEMLVRRRDHPARLTRTDTRYRREGMFRAKVHHFARGGWLRGRSGVVIGGSGTSGRKVAALLREENVPVRCLLDNKVGPPGRTVRGVPAVGYPDEIPAAFFAEHPGAFYLSCIGEPPGRERLVRALLSQGLREGRDWLRFL